MSNMNFSNRVRVLGQFQEHFFADPDWNMFICHYNIGVPLAYCVWQDLATPTEEGREVIEETWLALCKWLDVNPDSNFLILDDLLRQSKVVKRVSS